MIICFAYEREHDQLGTSDHYLCRRCPRGISTTTLCTYQGAKGELFFPEIPVLHTSGDYVNSSRQHGIGIEVNAMSLWWIVLPDRGAALSSKGMLSPFF